MKQDDEESINILDNVNHECLKHSTRVLVLTKKIILLLNFAANF